MMAVANQRLSQASAIIEEAADKALHFFAAHQTVATHAKGVQDFVSEADTTVENFIRDRLATTFPGEAIVGEEFGGQSEGAYWIIDPIDGTSNFLRGSPLWGISLGFVRDGRPELGVVAMPVMGEIYAAADGTGVLMNGRPLARTIPPQDVRIMSLGDSLADDLDDAAKLQIGLRHAGWVVEAFHSTSVSLVFAARGIFDGHLQKVTTMWDIAGGAVLAREAGLKVRIGQDATSRVPWIAAGTPALLAATEPLWPEIRKDHPDD